jgi:uncharacterized membrane protein
MPIFSFSISFVVLPLTFKLISILKPFDSITSSLSLLINIACIYASYILRQSYFFNIFQSFLFYQIL